MDCRMATALDLFSECVQLNEAAGLTRVLTANLAIMGACRGYLCAFEAGCGDMRRDSRSPAELITATGSCLHCFRSFPQ